MDASGRSGIAPEQWPYRIDAIRKLAPPTEYLRADLLRAYIRDPQALRRWPQARMPGFDSSMLADADLEALLSYLRHMAGRKPDPATP